MSKVSRMVTFQINGHCYQMSNKMAKNNLLIMARQSLPKFSIYAIYKNDCYMALNETYNSKKELDQAVSKYESEGFVVYKKVR